VSLCFNFVPLLRSVGFLVQSSVERESRITDMYSYLRESVHLGNLIFQCLVHWPYLVVSYLQEEYNSPSLCLANVVFPWNSFIQMRRVFTSKRWSSHFADENNWIAIPTSTRNVVYLKMGHWECALDRFFECISVNRHFPILIDDEELTISGINAYKRLAIACTDESRSWSDKMHPTN